MLTFAFSVLLVLVSGVALETRFNLPRFFAAGRGVFQVGKLAFAGVVYRPGRVYVRIGAV